MLLELEGGDDDSCRKTLSNPSGDGEAAGDPGYDNEVRGEVWCWPPPCCCPLTLPLTPSVGVERAGTRRCD